MLSYRVLRYQPLTPVLTSNFSEEFKHQIKKTNTLHKTSPVFSTLVGPFCRPPTAGGVLNLT